MSENDLGKYSFLPWIKSGLGAYVITRERDSEPRAKIKARINIKRYKLDHTLHDDTADPKYVEKEFFLYGPGDIIPIVKKAILRRGPEPNCAHTESNYFPLIESPQGDFFWRYTPAIPNEDTLSRLTPWLTLIVLRRDEFEGPIRVNGIPQITVKNCDISLPDLSQAWAWAHCQITEDVSNPERITEILKTEPHKVISRLLCPRELLPNTKYFAFLVPTFKAGLLASIAKSIPDGLPGTELAWDHSSPGSITIGYYDSWQFNTGPEGDFESLARKLVARELNENIGIRDIDLSDHNFEKIPLLTKSLTLGGALWSQKAFERRKKLDVRTCSITPESDDNPSQTELVAFIDGIKRYLDIDEKYKWLYENNSNQELKDPIISLPKYGKWHASKRLITRIEDINNPPGWIAELNLSPDFLNKIKNDPPYKWFEELNLDPSNRAASGFGTAAVQELQEEIMAAAWDQAKDIKRISNILKWAQLSRTISMRIFEKNFEKFSQNALISVTSPLQNKLISIEEKKSLKKILNESPISQFFFTPSFKKITRRRGKTHRLALDPATHLKNNILDIFNRNPSNPNPNPPTPEDLLTFDTITEDPNSGLQDKDESDFHSNLIIPSLLKRFLLRITAWACRHKIFVILCVILQIILKLLYKDIRENPYNPAEVENFRRMATEIETSIPAADATISEREGVVVSLENIHNKLIKGLNPKRTIEKKVSLEIDRRLRLNEKFKDPLDPIILSYFKVKRPMYEALLPDNLLPGVGEIEENTISGLRTNPVFVKSYMVSINDAIAKECLWREYFTDLRASFSRQFWDPSIGVERDRLIKMEGRNQLSEQEEECIREKYRDIEEIHRWKDIPLEEPPGEEEGVHTVLLIKGELLKRYPTAIIYAIHGIFHVTCPVLPTIKDSTTDNYLYEDKAKWELDRHPEWVKDPIFRGFIEPDITFFGFDIHPEEMEGDLDEIDDDRKAGWFFIIQQQLGEPLFGGDLKSGEVKQIYNANDVSWDHFKCSDSGYIIIGHDDEPEELKVISTNGLPDNSEVKWGSHAGDIAFITHQQPVRVAIHGSEIIKVKENN